MNYLIGHYSDKGIKKEVNQDALLIKTAKSPYGRIALFAISDGMGGLSAGELASTTVISQFSEWFDNALGHLNFNEINEEEIISKMETVIFNANEKILNYSRKENMVMGTTLTIMLTIDTKYYICHVGDSRAYKINSEFEILTEDQTFVAREIGLGNMTVEEAKVDKRRNALLQCIGAKSVVEPQYICGELEENNIYIICSDGFYKKLNDKEIINELNPNSFYSSSRLDEKARELSNRVMDRREVDNISAILIKTIN